jgi:hypothetical protein
LRFIKTILFCLIVCSAKAQPAGPNNPGTSGTNTSVGTITWANSGNIFVSDNNRGTAILNSNGDVSHYLTATNFGFSIPASSVIDGIVVDVERSDNGGGGNIRDNSVRIIKGGVISGTDHSVVINWPSTDSYRTYGSPTDLWGVTWTEADINASDFGIAISSGRIGGGAGNSARIDHIRITIHYSFSLPVELMSFSANQAEGLIKIEWETLSEINNDYFLLEKTYDGVHFYEIDRVKGRGTYPFRSQYSSFDKEPSEGVNYYRLTQFDFDGKSETLQIICCNFISEGRSVVINIFELSGRLVYSENSIFSKRLSIINKTELSEGAYVIQSVSSNGVVLMSERLMFYRRSPK